MGENKKRYDLTISGISNSDGGTFDRVSINGVASIYGDLDCIDLDVNGSCKIEGGIRSNSIKLNGNIKVNGSLIADEAEEVNAAGGLAGDGLGKVELKGLIKIMENCNCESFISKGVFNVGGMLNAGNIDIELYGACRVREVGGGRIRVKKTGGLGFRRFLRSIFPSSDIADGFVTECIEGDEIYLEYTRAKVVRGENVVIGKGCEIELVEYRGNFENRGDSKVIESRKEG